MTLLILAAGMGSRYGGDKQFDGVGPCQEYLLEFTTFDAIQAGIKHLVIVTKREAIDEVSQYFESRLPSSVMLECVAQSLDDVPSGFELPASRVKPWGTAHAVWSARNVIKGKFATVNADDLYGRKGIEAAVSCMRENPDGGKFGLIGYRLKDTLSAFGTVSRGVCKENNGFLRSVVEHTKLRAIDETQIIDDATDTTFMGDELTSMNLWVADDTIFASIERYFSEYFSEEKNIASGELYLPLIVQCLIDTNQASVKLTDSKSEWHGMTYKKDRKLLEDVLRSLTNNRTYPSPLWISS